MKKLFLILITLIVTAALWAGNVITYTASAKLPEVTGESTFGLHIDAFNVSIQSHTFSNGKGTITFAGEVTSVGDGAFWNSTSLTSISIPNSVTKIGNNAFRNCRMLSSITIPNLVTSIGYRAFSDCESLASITIPNSVTSIGDYTFYNCATLATITIPDSVTSIGSSAFYDCSSLTYITCEAINPPTCGNRCFENVPTTIPVYVPASSVAAYKTADVWNGFTNIQVMHSQVNYVITYTATSKLPETTNASSSGLHTNAFNVSISSHTFSNGTGTITFAGEVTSIGNYAFGGSTFTHINLPYSVNSIGEGAFSGCFNLVSISLSNNVTNIGKFAFYSCYGLTSATISSSVKSIGDHVFTWCTSLQSIDVDTDNIHYVSDDGVLYNYTKDSLLQYPVGNSRTTYIIPDGVKSIGEYAFHKSNSLSSITIPNSVNMIGADAFSNCTTLVSITCYAINPPACGSCAFELVDTSIPLYVPASSVAAYKSAVGWKDFTNIQAIQDGESDTIQISGIQYADGYYYTEGDVAYWDFDLYKDYDNDSSKYIYPELYVSLAEPANSKTSIVGDYELRFAYYWKRANDSIEVDNGKLSISYNSLDNTYNFVCNFTDSDGKTYQMSAQNLSVLAYDYEASEEIQLKEEPTNVITYTATSKLPETNSQWAEGIYVDAFDVTIVSHEFSDGVGTITFSGEVKSIGDNAFCGSSSLTSVTIPNSVTSIGMWSFSTCPSLTSVNIPNGVTSIGTGAFNECGSLTNIIIPNTVTSIGSSAFTACRFLTSITIPNSVTSIGEWAFSGSSISCITIPNSVESIAQGTFAYCYSLTSINISNSVTSIGWQAFSGCTALTSITIPNSVTNIDGYAFSGCTSLASITCEAVDPPTCGTGCFENVDKSIPVYVPFFSVIAYQSAEGWKDFTNIQDIDEQTQTGSVITYKATSKLTETTSDSKSGLHTNAFNVAITSHTFSNGTGTITFDGDVTSIGEDAFYFCDSLTYITIPNSVISIGNNAFYYCKSLTSVTIPNSVISIGDGAFRDCYALTSVTIPYSVTSVGSYAFESCYSLKSITLSNSVTSIGRNTFSNCESLTSITIPSSVTSIGVYAFSGCTSLFSIDVDAANTHYASIDGVLFNYAKDILIQCPIGNSRTAYTIPNSVTSIGNYAFSYCASLKSITIPNNVTSIGNNAFSNCTSLISVTIGNSVANIGEMVLTLCSSLTSITCYATTPPTCSTNSFYIVDKSIPVYVPEGSVTAYKSAVGWKEFTNIQAIGGQTQTGSVITYTATEKLTETTGQNTAGLHTNAFNVAITSHTFSSGIGTITFADEVTNIGEHAFYFCESMTSISIPNSVITVGKEAFSYCTSIQSITIPNSVKSIGYGAFFHCSSLASITIGNSVTNIENYAFRECTSLASIVIPNSVSKIGHKAFYQCGHLQSVTLGTNVDFIDTYAFGDNANLHEVFSYAINPPVAGPFAFGEEQAVLYIPCESMLWYKISAMGYQFKDIQCLDEAQQQNSIYHNAPERIHSAETIKMIQNGQLLIQYDGHTYNAQGQEL